MTITNYPNIRARHDNGYAGLLYGKTSMSIYAPDGRECLHTSKRAINTEKELLELLADMPGFFRRFEEVDE